MTGDDLEHPLVKLADKHVDKTLDRIDRAFAPMYEGDKELTRTLMSLSTAALVLSIGMIQFLLSRHDALLDVSWLPVAWGCFLTTIVAGAGRIVQSGAATGLRLNFERRRYDMRMQLKSASAENVEQAYQQALEDAWNPAWDATMSSVKSYNRIGILMVGSFVAGMLTLLAFGAANLPG